MTIALSIFAIIVAAFLVLSLRRNQEDCDRVLSVLTFEPKTQDVIEAEAFPGEDVLTARVYVALRRLEDEGWAKHTLIDDQRRSRPAWERRRLGTRRKGTAAYRVKHATTSEAASATGETG